MRIGAIWHFNNNCFYRAIDPLRAMALRGHEVVVPEDHQRGRVPFAQLLRCDVVHIYRSWEDDARDIAAELANRGVGVVYDNDDDYTLVTKSAHSYRNIGGIKAEVIHRNMLRVARRAHVTTTTSPFLAERFSAAGMPNVKVIPNQILRDVYRPVNRHPGIRIGWIAGGEHQIDADVLGIPAVLERIVDAHPDVSVETFGLNLRLPRRYEHTPIVRFGEVPRQMARWDIGIAPLTDIPFNRMRSDIKVKEYAASGLAWLASPVAPYAGLGEREGGRLVEADEWHEALERLVTRRRERRRLARRARAWAKGQTIEATAERWERVFQEAAELASGAPDLAAASAR